MKKYADQIKINYTDIFEDGMQEKYIEEMANIFKRVNEKYLESMQERYKEKYEAKHPDDFWVLVVIDKDERNICDQKYIESALFEKHNIKSVRMTLE